LYLTANRSVDRVSHYGIIILSFQFIIFHSPRCRKWSHERHWMYRYVRTK